MAIKITPYISELDANGKRLLQTNATGVSDPNNAIGLSGGYVVLANKAALNFTTPRATRSFTLTRSGYANKIATYIKGESTVLTITPSAPITANSPIGTVVGILSHTGVEATLQVMAITPGASLTANSPAGSVVGTISTTDVVAQTV